MHLLLLFHLQESFISAFNSCSNWQWGLWQSQAALKHLTLQIRLLRLEYLQSHSKIFFCYWLFRSLTGSTSVFSVLLFSDKQLNHTKEKGDRAFVIFLPWERKNFSLAHFWSCTKNVALSSTVCQKILLHWEFRAVVQHDCCTLIKALPSSAASLQLPSSAP